VTPTLGGVRLPLPYSHASALAAIPRARVVAVCDLVPELRQTFLDRWGATWDGIKAYDDVTEMLAREEIDILGVCTPDDKHADIVIAASDRGVPGILCEKPLATTLRDADRMIEALDRNGTICSVEHTRRWDPFFHRVKELIDAGTIGEVRTIVGTLHGERAMIFRNGTHLIDLICYYAGAAPTHVFAVLEEGFEDFAEYRGDGGHDPSSEPAASAFIQFANGVRAFFNGAKRTPSLGEWDITGSRGRIRINGSFAELWTLNKDDGELVQRAFPATMVMTGAIQGAYEELIAALAGNGGVRSTAREARMTVAILEGILRSQQQGNRLVELN
jgi:predicted dehydrogenase